MSIKSQIWVETVIYTLIGLVIMAVILAVAMPQIEKSKDRNIVIQTLNAMNVLDEAIEKVSQTPGNNLIVNFKLSKGNLKIDSENNKLIYTLEGTKYLASELDQEINQGNNIFLKTEKAGGKYKITLTKDYSSSIDLTYNEGNYARVLTPGGNAYKISIENLESEELTTNINIRII
jgi:type II secretory pathway pseudopilin PulG